MADERNGPGPGRRPAVNPEDVVRVLEKSKEPALATTDIAEELDVSRVTATKRLEELEEMGGVAHTTIGGAKAWYLPEMLNRRLSEYSEDDAPPVPEGGEIDTDGGGQTPMSRGELMRVIEEYANRAAQAAANAAREEAREGAVEGLEEWEESRIQVENDDENGEETPDTWGEQAILEARKAWEAVKKAAVVTVGAVFLLALLTTFLPEVARYSLPWVDVRVEFVIALFGGAGLFVFGVGCVFTFVYYAGGKTGFADWLEPRYRRARARVLERVPDVDEAKAWLHTHNPLPRRPN